MKSRIMGTALLLTILVFSFLLSGALCTPPKSTPPSGDGNTGVQTGRVTLRLKFHASHRAALPVSMRISWWGEMPNPPSGTGETSFLEEREYELFTDTSGNVYSDLIVFNLRPGTWEFGVATPYWASNALHTGTETCQHEVLAGDWLSVRFAVYEYGCTTGWKYPGD